MGDVKKQKFATVNIEDININYATNIFILDNSIRCRSKKQRNLACWSQLDEETKKSIILTEIDDEYDDDSPYYLCDICLFSKNKTIQLSHCIPTKCQDIRHFCGTCISLWIYHNKDRATCPICRQDIMYRSPYASKYDKK